MVYWRPLEVTDTFAAETEPAEIAGASCFETAVEMEWPALLDKREAARESMVDLFVWLFVILLIYELAAFIGCFVGG